MQKKSFHFTPLNLPPRQLQVENRDCRPHVYDSLRHKWLVLTDEEWVRQHFVRHLIDDLGYPASAVANEVGLRLNDTGRRVDTLVFDRNARPLMIVEYKAPSVEITQDVFDQIVRYNMVLRARLLVVTNGLRHYCCAIDYATNSYKYLRDLPTYSAALTFPAAPEID